MTTDWFYMPDIPAPGEQAELDRDEARHALGSRRLTEGDVMTLFDGRGTVAAATIVSSSKRATLLAIVERVTVDVPPWRITLASALPKGDRQAVMLNMATQLGMTAFVPLVCERSVAKPGEGFAARAQRLFIEGCKQSRRPHLPTLRPALAPAEAVSEAAQRGDLVLLADPVGEPFSAFSARSMTLLIGPEGGFSDAERKQCATRGARAITFGETILRTETAAVAMLACASILARAFAK